jgi:hypothetical protein
MTAYFFKEFDVLSYPMKQAMKNCFESDGEMYRHHFTGDGYGRFYVAHDQVSSKPVRWSASVPTVKALHRRKLIEITESSGDTRENFRPEVLRLNAQGMALAKLVSEIGVRKFPGWYVIENDGAVVWGEFEELEAHLKNLAKNFKRPASS